MFQSAKVIWLTGLSGAGKTTLSLALEEKLKANNYLTVVLDGDLLRNGINSNLGFEMPDRIENIRRIAEIAKLFLEKKIITIVAVISPLETMRQMAKSIIGGDNFIEVYINTPIEICEKRDVKGLYKKARAGLIQSFTGVNDIYEAPINTFTINTDGISVEDSANLLCDYILPRILK